MKAQEYKIGNSTVIIRDDYVAKTDMERQERLDAIGNLVSKTLSLQKESA